MQSLRMTRKAEVRRVWRSAHIGSNRLTAIPWSSGEVVAQSHCNETAACVVSVTAIPRSARSNVVADMSVFIRAQLAQNLATRQCLGGAQGLTTSCCSSILSSVTRFVMPLCRSCLALGLLVFFSHAWTGYSQIGKGHLILIQRGLQLQGLVTRDDVFHLNTYSNANYTSIHWLWDSNPSLMGAAPGFP